MSYSSKTLSHLRKRLTSLRVAYLPTIVLIFALLALLPQLSAQTCTLSTTNPSVTICAPLNNATVTSPVNLVAGTTDSYSIRSMQVYVDTTLVYQTAANSLNITGAIATGTHTITVQASDRRGRTFGSKINLTVVSSTTTLAVSNVAPSSGSTLGGTAVTIAGSGFQSGATVSFGGSAASGVTVVSATQLTATTPAHAAGGVSVAVTNTSGQSATLGNGYTFVAPVAPLAITTSSLPDGQVGSAYQASLQASGGVTPYTWSLNSGTLPAGLALQSNGTISGTPSQAGTISFGVQAQDSAGTTASAVLSIFVASAPVSGTPVTACGTLNAAGTTYVLQNDVSATGTCFSVQANNITLDLNGHTITYATGGGTQPRYGVLGEACWDPGLAGNPCGGSFQNLVVRNGKIVQSSSAASFSHGIRVGQGTGSGLTVYNVTLTLVVDSSIPILTTFSGAGQNIYNNTIYNNVPTIQNRQNMQGMSIEFSGDTNATLPSLVHGNTIIGGVQGGILVTSPGSQVYSNTINLNGSYTNDFCIYAWGNNQQVYSNTCSSISGSQAGRGIQVDNASGVKLYNNTLATRDLARNVEYNGCALGGNYGIQLEQHATNTEVYNNVVAVYASQCDAQALRLTTAGAQNSGNNIHNNSFGAYRIGTTTKAANAISAISIYPSNGMTITSNTFVADSAILQIDYTGATQLQLTGNTVQKGSNPASAWYLVRFQNGANYAATGNVLQDTVYQAGALDAAGMLVQGTSAGAQEYFVNWTLALTVLNQNSQPVAGATVSITNAQGLSAFSGATSGSGYVAAPLTQTRHYNTTGGVFTQTQTPDKVTISAPGCASQTFSVTMSAPIQLTRQLTCQ